MRPHIADRNQSSTPRILTATGDSARLEVVVVPPPDPDPADPAPAKPFLAFRLDAGGSPGTRATVLGAAETVQGAVQIATDQESAPDVRFVVGKIEKVFVLKRVYEVEEVSGNFSG